RQMVLLVPPRLAELAELADLAVLYRIGFRARRVLHEAEEAIANAAVIGEEVEDAVGLTLAGAELDVHPLGDAALDAPNLLGVETKLQHVRRLAVTRELRVDGLVGTVRLEDDEVREPAPFSVHE